MDNHADDKLMILIARYGAEGYGLYWMILELLCKKDLHKIIDNEDTAEILSSQSKINDMQKVRELIDFMVCKDILQKMDDKLFSISLNCNLDEIQEAAEKRSEKARKAAFSRWEDDATN